MSPLGVLLSAVSSKTWLKIIVGILLRGITCWRLFFLYLGVLEEGCCHEVFWVPRYSCLLVLYFDLKIWDAGVGMGSLDKSELIYQGCLHRNIIDSAHPITSGVSLFHFVIVGNIKRKNYTSHKILLRGSFLELYQHIVELIGLLFLLVSYHLLFFLGQSIVSI